MLVPLFGAWSQERSIIVSSSSIHGCDKVLVGLPVVQQYPPLLP